MSAPHPSPRPGRVPLALFLAIELLVAIAVLAVRPGNLGSPGASSDAATTAPRAVPPARPGASTPGTAATQPPLSVAPGMKPAAGQTVVTGTIGHLQAFSATVGAVPMPIRVRSATRGFGNSATINDAQVHGSSADVEWDAGTPFPLSGSGQLHLAGVLVHIDGAVVTVQLGGGTYPLSPGTYHLASPAAVSTAGLATPVSEVDFTATAATTVTFTGSETFNLDLPRHLTGPGKVILDGNFTVHTAHGSTPATHVELATGPYDLKVTPAADGAPGPTLTAVLQGTVTTS